MQRDNIERHPVLHLLDYSTDYPVTVQIFVDCYLRSLHRSGDHVEIQHPGTQWEHAGFWLLNVKPPDTKPTVIEPIRYLNPLLRHVMKTGQAQIPIAADIVYGFANAGWGFYPEFRYLLPKKRRLLLSPDVKFPAHLVVETANGSRWTRPPEDGKEQLYHFIFHLRATMEYLAQEPIGKRSMLSVAEASQMLVKLPKRAAWVHSGDKMGVIYTDDTLPMVSPTALRQRLDLIQSQTRQKYCRPKSDVEQEPEVKPEPKRSGWEVVE